MEKNMKPWVLIVDDSLTVRMDLEEAFESIGFATNASQTLAAARKALAERSFSLIILDVLLPDGDGIDLLREIKDASTTAAVPVILLSSEAEVCDRVRGLNTKRRLALQEYSLGLEALHRFVERAPLRAVHECVFGVLALESEPVDPRL